MHRYTYNSAMVIGTITESDYIMEEAAASEGGYVSMCGALERLEKRCVEQGIEQGIERGIKQGIERGIEQEKKKIILQMLKEGMDKGLIGEITDADETVIDKLHREIQM